MPWFTLFPTLAEAEARVPVGRMFTVRLPRPPFRICLVRRADGAWRAFEDSCPHQKALFSRGGHLNLAGNVVCPLHHYVFDLDNGQEVTGERCPNLDTFPIEIDDEGLRVKTY